MLILVTLRYIKLTLQKIDSWNRDTYFYLGFYRTMEKFVMAFSKLFFRKTTTKSTTTTTVTTTTTTKRQTVWTKSPELGIKNSKTSDEETDEGTGSTSNVVRGIVIGLSLVALVTLGILGLLW